MQLKIQRSQRASTFGNPIFCLDLRADYSPEEQGDIDKYRLGSQVIYSSEAAKRHYARMDAHMALVEVENTSGKLGRLARGMTSLAMAKMSLNVSVASLAKGHHIECKDLEELLDAENTLRVACAKITEYLEAAATFNGGEIVIEYEKGEERVRIAHEAPPLLAYAAPEAADDLAYEPMDGAIPDDWARSAFLDVGLFLGGWGKAIEVAVNRAVGPYGWKFTSSQIFYSALITVLAIVLVVRFG